MGGFVAVVALAAAGTAQETSTTFEFSFSTPGARSVGIGGAFAGLADDARVASGNPAGLVQLTEPEVSTELRHWSYSTPNVEGGRFEGEPTLIGLDTENGLRIAVSEEDLSGLSFLSFVDPKGRWSFALYAHQLANFRARTAIQGLFHSDHPPRSVDRRWDSELDIVGYGAGRECTGSATVSVSTHPVKTRSTSRRESVSPSARFNSTLQPTHPSSSTPSRCRQSTPSERTARSTRGEAP